MIVRDLLTETRFSGPTLLRDHQVRSGMSTIVAGIGKRPFGVFGAHSTQLRDFDQPDVEFLISLTNVISNSVRHLAAEEQRNLLMREMTHRAGNMLQLVASIANQTFTDGAITQNARDAFSQRLSALANANYLIAREGWTSTRFIALLEETLEPFREQLDFLGRDILLPPQLCFDLGLVVHELATNSVKYGALGLAGRKVALSWELTDSADGGQTFKFVWDDPITNSDTPATGTRLGTKLISMTIERKWSGKSRTEIGEGYRFSFELPVPKAE